MTTAITIPRSFREAQTISSQGIRVVNGAEIVTEEDGSFLVRRETSEVVFYRDGSIELWARLRTPTAKGLINQCLPMGEQHGWRLVSHDYNWMLERFNRQTGTVVKRVPFRDGITLQPPTKE